MPDHRFDDSPFSGITPRRVRRRPVPSSESPFPASTPFSSSGRPPGRRSETGRPIPPPPRTSRRFDAVPADDEPDRRRSGPGTSRTSTRPDSGQGRRVRSGFDDPAPARGDRTRTRSNRADDPLRDTMSGRSRQGGRERDRGWIADDDDGWEDARPDEATGGARTVLAGGPGGRMLAVAGVLFLILSLTIAGVGGMLSQGDGNDELAAIPGEELPGPIVPTATVDDGPLVSWDDSPLPTMTLPPAGQLERGAEGRYLDGVRTVCIDPGHGGPDRGRTFAGDGNIPALEEADFTLEQGFLLHDLLVDRGYVVVMTRTDDEAVNVDGADVNGDGRTIADDDRAGTYDEIQARINVCNRANADLLVSVHINGFDTGRPSGFEAWYTADRPFGEQSAVFAQLGVEALGARMAEVGYEPENRGAKDDGTYSVDDSDPSLAHNMLLTGPELPGALVPSLMPGAIMEPAFITNLDDAAFLLSDDGNAIIAQAYADAIDGYFDRFES